MHNRPGGRSRWAEILGNEKQADVLDSDEDRASAQAVSVFYRSQFAAEVKVDLLSNDLLSRFSTTRVLKHL